LIESGNPDFENLIGLSNCTFEFDKQVQTCLGILETNFQSEHKLGNRR